MVAEVPSAGLSFPYVDEYRKRQQRSLLATCSFYRFKDTRIPPTCALRGDRPCVGDFVRVGLPDLVRPKRGNGDRLAIQCHELDFVASSFPMHEHDSADVSGRKLLLPQITREHDLVRFRESELARSGY